MRPLAPLLFSISVGLLGILIGILIQQTIGTREVISPKKIEPEIRFTTDGKTVDTLYIYKLEK